MYQNIIRLGDSTSHGGKVVTCSPFTDIDGLGVARVGDKVTCPRCRGVHVIVRGNASLNVDGQAAAYHGCKTSCGATLLCSQVVCGTEPSAGLGTSAISAPAPSGFGDIGGNWMSGYEDEAIPDAPHRFRGRFRVCERTSSEPVSGQAFMVRSTGGQVVKSATDADGFTAWIERDANEALTFDLIQSIA